jgi:tRNA-dihydrouridine synthase B
MAFTYMLAPLEDTSDKALRTLCHRYGADITFTEMARTDSLARANKSTLAKTELSGDVPTWIQITGGREQMLKKYLSSFQPEKNFLGFNFNVGCPSPHLIRDGLGCAMIKRIAKMRKLVGIVQDRGYPVSVKMRLGMNAMEKERKVYLNLIDALDVEFFVVHARVGSDTYAKPADYSAIAECAASGKSIIANGDVYSREQAEKLKELGAQGVMIGRAAVFNPAIFNVLKGEEAPSIEQLKAEYLELSQRFNAPFKYQKNVLKRLGRPVETISALHDAEEAEHVMG